MREHPENTAFRDIVRVAIIAAALLAVVLAFFYWQSDNIRDSFKTMRGLGFTDDIEEAIEAGNFREARQLLDEAYPLAPNAPKLLRLAATVAVHDRSADAHFFLDRIEALGKTTFEDRVLRGEAYLALLDLEHGEQIAQSLLQEQPESHRVLSLLVDLQVAREHYADATGTLAKLVRFHRDDLGRKLQLADVLINHGSREESERGWRYRWEIAEGEGAAARLALDAICDSPDLILPFKKKLADLIEHHPAATARHHVYALKLQTELSPRRKMAIMRDAVDACFASAAYDPGELFRWLSEEGEHEFILDRLPLDKARRSQALMMVYLETLGHQGRWVEVRQHLENPRTPLPDTRRHLLGANCAEQLNEDPMAVKSFVQKALAAASRSSNPDQALRVGEFAEERGLFDTALSAYELASADVQFAVKCYEGMIRLASTLQDTAKLRRIADLYAQRFPLRTDLRERTLYLNALIGYELELALQDALMLVEAEPGRAAPRIIAGLSLYRMNDFESAFKICESCRTEKLSPAQKAVWAAIAARSRRPGPAAALARQIDRAALLREEQHLLKSLGDTTDTVQQVRPRQSQAVAP